MAGIFVDSSPLLNAVSVLSYFITKCLGPNSVEQLYFQRFCLICVFLVIRTVKLCNYY